MSETVTLGVRVKQSKADALEKLAEATDRPKSWLIEQALDQYLETQAWQVEHIRQGLAELDAGQGYEHTEIKAWLESWGTDDEHEPPA